MFLFGYSCGIGINSPFVLAFCGSCDSRTRGFKDELFNLPLNQIVFYLPNPSKSLVESIINSPLVPSYMQIMGSYNTLRFGVASYAIFLTTLYDNSLPNCVDHMCKSGQNVAIECKLFFVHCKALTQNLSASRGHIIKQKVSFTKVGHLKKTHALASISYFETHNFYFQFFSP